MNKSELLEKLKDKHPRSYKGLDKETKETIQIFSKHLSNKTSLTERVYNISNNITSQPLCQNCGINPVKFMSTKIGYKKYCSSKCSNSSKEVQDKKERTVLKNYGVSNPSHSKVVLDKIKQTTFDRYGVENVMQDKVIKERLIESMLNRSSEEKEKTLKLHEETCQKKYGVNNVSQSSIVKKKKEETTLKNYGVNNPNQSEIIKKKKEETTLKNYGVNNPMKSEILLDKIKTSNINKFGCNWIFQNQQIKEKIKNTIQDKYGVDSISKSEEIKKKKQETSLKNYGVNNPNQSELIKNQKKETCLEKYGVDNPSKTKEFKTFISNKLKKEFLEKFDLLQKYFKIQLIDNDYENSGYKHTWKCTECGNEYTQIWNEIQQGYKCPICYPRNIGTSLQEKEIFNFIKGLIPSNEIIENSRQIIPPKELDIYIPSKKIAIEFNGLYWHSDQMLDDKNYHLTKTIECEKQGIQLIHIFEDEWIFKQDIVKARLKQLLNITTSKRIHARKCIIKEIEPSIKNNFLETYHIQGKDNSIIKLGAFHQDELVSVMTFSKGNISKGSKPKENTWELNRFCSNSNYHIPGIASKLLKHFQRNYRWEEIFSYADRRWSNGNLYYKLGFNLEKETGINYWYTDTFQRIHRFNLRRDKETPKELTEQEWRVSQGYSIIYDCGSLKFNLTK